MVLLAAIAALAASSSPAIAAPVNVVRPAVVTPDDGDVYPGDTVSVTQGGWSATSAMTFTYVWDRCIVNADAPKAPGYCAAVSGATTQTYTATTSDTGFRLRARVTATAAGESVTVSSANFTPIVAPASLPTAEELAADTGSNASPVEQSCVGGAPAAFRAVWTPGARGLAPRVSDGEVVLPAEHGSVILRPSAMTKGKYAPSSRGILMTGTAPGSSWTIEPPAYRARATAKGLRITGPTGKAAADIVSLGEDQDAPVLRVSQEGTRVTVVGTNPANLEAVPLSGEDVVYPVCAPQGNVQTASRQDREQKCEFIPLLPFRTQVDRVDPLANGRASLNCPPDTGVYYMQVIVDLGVKNGAKYDSRAKAIDDLLILGRTRSVVATARARCVGKVGAGRTWFLYSFTEAFSTVRPYIRASSDLSAQLLSGCF